MPVREPLLCFPYVLLWFSSFFTGYLLIYISYTFPSPMMCSFYGLLKTIGTTPKQIKRIVSSAGYTPLPYWNTYWHYPVVAASLGVVPFLISELGAISTDEAVVSFSPIIYVGAVFFPLLTAILAASKPARKAAMFLP